MLENAHKYEWRIFAPNESFANSGGANDRKSHLAWNNDEKQVKHRNHLFSNSLSKFVKHVDFCCTEISLENNEIIYTQRDSTRFELSKNEFAHTVAMAQTPTHKQIKMYPM